MTDAVQDLHPEIAQALLTTLESVQARDRVPSDDVIAAAMTLLKHHGPDPVVAPAIVYKAPSQTHPWREHLVVLYLDGSPPSDRGGVFVQRPAIVGAECSCEATVVCRHLVWALTHAELDGYHLEASP